MKVLSDNTADRLLRHLDAAEGGIMPRRIPRGASTTPPALMWQVHVVPSTGAVTIDGGDVYADGARYSLAASSLGTATDSSLVVWTASESGGGEITLEAEDWTPSDDATCRVIAAIIADPDTGKYSSRQYIDCPIEADAGHHFGKSDGATETDSWEISSGKPAILPLDLGDSGKVKLLVDSRGNVLAWNAGENPEDPEGPADPPPCGNPLNADDDDSNPLDTDDPDTPDDPSDPDSPDHNPLDYEGDGGYTPVCGKEAA